MSAPNQPPNKGGPLVPSRPINFSINIEGPDGEDADPVTDNEVREMPFDGLVTKAYVDIPDGVHSRAGFAVWHKSRKDRYFPYNEEDDWAAFNDVQNWWDVTFVAEEGDELEVRYINEDHQAEGHLLKVWLMVVGIEALPASMQEYARRDGVSL